MKWELAALVVLCAVFVKSVPLAEKISPPTDRIVTDEDPFSFLDEVRAFSDADDEDPENYRLPNNSRPIRYDLYLRTAVHEANFDFSGIVTIQIKILEPSTTITLHQRQLTIDRVDHVDATGAILNGDLANSYEEEREFLTITLPTLVNTDAEIFVKITYHGILRTDNTGFYRASYNDTDGNRVWFATTQFEMVDARHGMPCYDEPGIRAVMGVSIEHGVDYNAISNMPVMSRTTVAENPAYVVTKFEDTIALQTYLLAFVISDYKYVSNNDAAFPQRVYARPQMIDGGYAQNAIEIVGPIHYKLQELLEIELPIPKMDHAAIYDYRYGAMENMGLITYTEAGLLTNSRNSITTLVAHEYAHQFFGDLVAPQWWAYTWLNEGFATLFSNYASEKAFPGNNHWVNFASVFNSAFNFDVPTNANSKPLNFYVQKPLDIEAKFNTISYQKGGSVLRTFMEALGEDVFLRGLHLYLDEMKFLTATPQDLHRNLQKAYDERFPSEAIDIDALMSTWEVQAGFPTIHVSKISDGFLLEQSRVGGADEVYAIPLSYARTMNPDFENRKPKIWLRSKTTFLDVSDSWVILNIQASAYYKVTYDKAIFPAFFETLNSAPETISPFHRNQLHQYLLTMLNAGTANPTDGFSMLQYMNKEDDPTTWNSASNIDTFYWGKLLGSDVFANYLSFAFERTTNLLNRLTVNPIEGESAEDANLRPAVIAFSCKTLHPNCLYYQLTRLQTFLSTGSGQYEVCSGVRTADEATYNQVLTMFLAAETSNARNTFIVGLGCSLDDDLINKYLDTAKDTSNALSATERRNVFTNTFGKSNVALATAIEYLRVNFAAIEAAAPNQLASIFSSLAGYINTPAQFQAMSAALDAAVTGGLVTTANANIVISAANTQMTWYSENEDAVKIWFGLIPDTTTEDTTTVTQPTTTTTQSSSSAPTTTTTQSTSSAPTTTTTQSSSSGAPTTQSTAEAATESTTAASAIVVSSFIVILACMVFKIIV